MKDFIKNFNKEKLEEAYRIKESYAKGEIPLDLANAQMKAHIGSLTPSELAYIEQELQQEVEDECIREKIDEMMAIYDGVLVNEDNLIYDLPLGHPLNNYFLENVEIKKLVENISLLLNGKYIKNQWDEAFENLNKFKIHLSRKQNQLYTALEQKGFDRPTKTMWLYDNEIRDKITNLTERISGEFDIDKFKSDYEDFKLSILDLIEKEDEILLPTSLELISEKEFVDMISGDKEIGYCLIQPKDDFIKGSKYSYKGVEPEYGVEDKNFAKDLADLLAKYDISSWNEDTPMDVREGKLSLNRINLLFQHLPVDISYVDENELVAFYSDTKHRVFPRSKGVIGRDVKNCHPANSVYVVEEIIEKFRSGEQSKAEFWINKPGLFIYIVYVAVRDSEGNFKGVMEMMQDCTRIRSLEGSKTLLDWEDTKEELYVYDMPEDIEIEITQVSSNKITELTKDTRLSDLLDQYPGLKDYMVSKSDKFQMMNTPMFKFMKKIATVEKISEKTGISFDRLQEEFKKYLDTLK